MIIKICEFCESEMKAKSKTRRFCNRSCQGKYNRKNPQRGNQIRKYQREYSQRQEVKEKRRENESKPEFRKKRNFLENTRYKERRIKYWKEYWKRTEVRLKIRERERIKRKSDKRYAIADRLRRSLNHALTKYSKTGKIMSSKKYGINWEEVIEGLKPFPKELKNFEIDHIFPLISFDLTKIEEIKKAFDPSNLQWLTIEENRKKGGKIL